MTDVTTYEDAGNDLCATFNTAWQAGAGLIYGEVPEIKWQGKADNKEPDAGKAWVRFSYTTVLQAPAALADSAGKRRDNNAGIVTVQVFVPLSQPDGWLMAKRLGVLARKAFLRRSNSGTIWFRRARINELEPDGSNHRLNVVAEFEYDELN